MIELFLRFMRLFMLTVRHRLDEYVLDSYKKDEKVSQIGYWRVRRKRTHLRASVPVRYELPGIPNCGTLLHDDLLVVDIGKIMQSREKLYESLQV